SSTSISSSPSPSPVLFSLPIRPPPPSPLFPYTTLFRSPLLLHRQVGEHGRVEAPVARRVRIDHGAAADRLHRRVEAQHVAVSFRSEEHTSELQSRENLVCRLLLEKKKK